VPIVLLNLRDEFEILICARNHQQWKVPCEITMPKAEPGMTQQPGLKCVVKGKSNLRPWYC
jgi:hypothetical protein